MDKGIQRSKQTETPSVSEGKNYLLAIGINDYWHCPKLHNAVKDIEDFIALMHSKYGFQSENTRLLYNENATHDRILEEFKRLVREIKPQDTVLIYFSGHGELDDILDEGFWIPVEAERGKENHYIRNSTIQKVLLKINSFHTFLIVDSCYSGSLFLDGKGKFVSDSYDFPSRWGLTSGRNTIVSDGKAGKNSPFATALLDTLRRLDKPMNVSALCDIIKQTVPASTNKLQKPIGDPLSIEGHKGGQFIFTPKISDKLIAEEEVAWKEATAKNTLLSYHRYLRQYPKGKYAAEADNRLDVLENQQVTTIIQSPVLNPQPEKVNVILENTNGNNLNAIKIIKNHLNLSLEEARNLVLRCPVRICENIERYSIQKMLQDFEECDIKFRIVTVENDELENLNTFEEIISYLSNYPNSVFRLRAVKKAQDLLDNLKLSETEKMKKKLQLEIEKLKMAK